MSVFLVYWFMWKRMLFILILVCLCSVFTGESNAETVNPTWWCVVCRDNGVLEIYTLPDFKLVFLVKNFNMAPRVLVDSGSASGVR